MSELISGKEALIALANDLDLEWRHPEREWFKAPKCSMRTQDFFSGVYQFRLKPQTIMINGIEVPKPFEPKIGDIYWIIDTSDPNGYSYIEFEDDKCDKNLIKLGAWRSEDEIKQVVEALQSVFNVK